MDIIAAIINFILLLWFISFCKTVKVSLKESNRELRCLKIELIEIKQQLYVTNSR